MDSETSKYDNDPRYPCKYGLKCYQKNEAHHKKYKHPPKNVTDKNESNDKKEKKDKKNKETSVTNKKADPSNKGKTKNMLTNWLMPPSKKQKLDGNKDNDRNDNEVESPVGRKNVDDPNTSKKVEENEELSKTNDKNSVATHIQSPKKECVSSSSKTIEPDRDSIGSVSLVPIKMDIETKLKSYFLVDMPDDFFKFWSFCESVSNLVLSKGNPLDALRNIGLKLVGPFEVIAGKFSENVVYNQSALLRHYRYYYDPPEFQTVIIAADDSSQYHLGYFRDDPKEKPVFVASNCAAKDGVIKSVAENLFGAVNVYLEDYKKKADPFAKLKVVKLQNSLTTFAKKENMTLSTSTVAMKKRQAKVATNTFHKAGLVVPMQKTKDIGYRELAETDETIKSILTKIKKSESEEERRAHFGKLQPIVTYANIANDESDFGTSLELGLDLFTFGDPVLHNTIKQLMITSYQLLKRNEFATIIEAHLEDRRKGSNISILKKQDT